MDDTNQPREHADPASATGLVEMAGEISSTKMVRLAAAAKEADSPAGP